MITLKKHDSWEAHGWLHSNTGGLYYRPRHYSTTQFIYVFYAVDDAEETREIVLKQDGDFEIVGRAFKDRENSFPSMTDAVRHIQNISCPKEHGYSHTYEWKKSD